MRVAHFTNTFLPHVGGVARAVQTIVEDQRRAHHRVLIVAPEFVDSPGQTKVPKNLERSVVRITAFTQYNDSEFSVGVPLATTRSTRLAEFRADLIHSHHPFLLGDTALREAASRQVPLVFTHHTLYEHYTHYLPASLQGETLNDFAAEVATRYANRCAAVFAPSESIRDLIRARGVTVPIHVVPTGIDCAQIATGRASRARTRYHLPRHVTVIGHVGRLADEKNLPYLAAALALSLAQKPTARALIVGEGPAREEMARLFAAAGPAIAMRVVFTGCLSGPALLDAYAAMDLFVFTSTSETQGLVLAEAMAAGTPVIALDASGVREVVSDGINGRLLAADSSPDDFARALTSALRKPSLRAKWAHAAIATANSLNREKTSVTLLAHYAEIIATHRVSTLALPSPPFLDRLAAEGHIIADKTGALFGALVGSVPHVALTHPLC